MVPHDVAVAVGVEVAGRRDLPVVARGAEPGERRGHVAVGMAPQDVADRRDAEDEIVGGQLVGQDVVEPQRVAAAEVDHGVAAVLGGERKHVVERMEVGEGVQVDPVVAAGTSRHVGRDVVVAAGSIHEGVVAQATGHGVVAAAAVELIVARTAHQHVVAGEAEQRVVSVRRRHLRRQAEHLAVEVDEVEIAERVLAERGGVADRARVGRDLVGAFGRDPVGAVEPQREHLADDESRRRNIVPAGLRSARGNHSRR